MRIAIATWSCRLVGGLETYLATVVEALAARGHAIAMVSNFDVPANRSRIPLPAGAPRWCAAEDGMQAAIDSLHEWRPDVIYAHGPLPEALEAAFSGIAPAAYFAHAYFDTCISGSKTNLWPSISQCHRKFGWRCLLHYYPHRCGGLSPVTMWSRYQRQKKRLARLRRYDAILTASDHMRREFLLHDFPEGNLHVVHLPVTNGTGRWTDSVNGFGLESKAPRHPSDGSSRECHLLFVGRLEALKGGHILIDSLGEISSSLGRPVRLTFAGDGRECERLKSHAAVCERRWSEVRVSFDGWLCGSDLERRFEQAELLVLPSLWPEPFGLVGLEAAKFGVPAVAFDVGGVREWLTDGVNGHLAPASPATASGLAAAVVRAASDRDHYTRLRQGAYHALAGFSLDSHVLSLLDLLSGIIDRPHASGTSREAVGSLTASASIPANQ